MRFANRNNQHNIISHSVAIHFSYYFGVVLEKKKFVINSIYNLQESARPTLKRRKRMYTSIRRIGAMMGTHKHVHWMNIIFQYVGNKRLKCWWWWWRLTATLTAAAKCTQSWIGTRLRHYLKAQNSMWMDARMRVRLCERGRGIDIPSKKQYDSSVFI